MKISFDLDDTLICYRRSAINEPVLPWYYRILGGNEPLRLGARHLMRELKARGWDVWIYTTSYRSPAAVRRWLWCHGVHVGGVINQQIHETYLCRDPNARPPSKNPRAFGMALHIDDLEGVGIEGQQHGFEVLVVTPDDVDWVEKVLTAAEQVARQMQSPGTSHSLQVTSPTN